MINPIIGLGAYILNAIGYVKIVAKDAKKISSPEEINGYIEIALFTSWGFRNSRRNSRNND